jgi:hypothetical protein
VSPWASPKESKALQKLDLRDTGVAGVGLADLKEPKGLRIDLTCSTISDARLASLKELKVLQELYLTNTGITDAGVEELQKSCQI